ncbi:MAG: fumarylacetoacetate hydrolase family protein [Bacteroidaceae bacterium]|nr:fumarylacetoacetate hydrolase family protein [Bacteroidaceae bacterium]
MKILAVGMNYAMHIDELSTISDKDNSSLLTQKSNNNGKNSLLPVEPVIFSKPDSAIIQPGKPFFVPDFAERFDYETEIVVRINRAGKDISQRFAHRYYDEVTVGIDFTARDLQTKLRNGGLPCELCKGFDGSAGIGKFIKVADIGGDVQNIDFHLEKNGTTVQSGNTRNMIFTIDSLISYVSRFFMLKTGDLLFTGTPFGVGPVNEGDILDGYIGEHHLLHLRIK